MGKIAEVSITTDSDQNEIIFLTYFCMLNRLKEQSDDKGGTKPLFSKLSKLSKFLQTSPNFSKLLQFFGEVWRIARMDLRVFSRMYMFSRTC